MGSGGCGRDYRTVAPETCIWQRALARRCPNFRFVLSPRAPFFLVCLLGGCRLARPQLEDVHGVRGVHVVDSPCLSRVPAALRAILQQQSSGADSASVVFADVCKDIGAPLASTVCALQREGDLPRHWSCVAAPHTYNPLGRSVTFLDADGIVGACLDVLEQQQQQQQQQHPPREAQL